MADDVLAIEGDVVLGGEVAHQRCCRAVHLGGVPLRALGGDALLLDADRVAVDVPVPGLPGDVLVLHHLRDMSVAGSHHVVGRGLLQRVLEDLQRGVEVLLRVVEDDELDLVAVRPVRGVVVAVRLLVGRIAGLLVGGRDPVAVQTARALRPYPVRARVCRGTEQRETQCADGGQRECASGPLLGRHDNPSWSWAFPEPCVSRGVRVSDLAFRCARTLSDLR